MPSAGAAAGAAPPPAGAAFCAAAMSFAAVSRSCWIRLAVAAESPEPLAPARLRPNAPAASSPSISVVMV